MAGKGEQLAYLAFGILCTLELVASAVPLKRYESLLKQQSEPASEELGLYDENDKVVKLTVANFNETVLEQQRGVLVEFYNTYCGHCRRFAPTYKQLAEQLHPWQDVLIVGAIDCAAEENNGICRTYEVMGYPTLRYMGPGFQPSANQFGQKVESQKPEEISSLLAGMIAAENQTVNNTHWPNVLPVLETESATVSALFDSLSSQRQNIALIYEPENSTLAIETSLYLLYWPAVQVRRFSDLAVAAKFNIDTTKHELALIDRQSSIKTLKPAVQSSLAYAKAIEDALRALNFTPRPEQLTEPEQPVSSKIQKDSPSGIISEVQRNKHIIYQADLEQAIHTILHNEVAKVNEIKGERLLALQRFLTVLQRYNPLGANGRQLVDKLKDFVVLFNQQLTGKQFEKELHRFTDMLGPIYSSTHFVGCAGSSPHLRGYSCSLWTLFHFLSVQAAGSDQTQDPLEVLQAMHGYIKNYFGCTDCSEHFQAMASRRKIWNVTSKDEAILWLWEAHNEVNQRLAGDDTEDPQFPKVQFPSPSSCAKCRREPAAADSKENLDINWDKDHVLSFLKNIHNPQFVSRFGVVHEELLFESLDKMRQKRQISSVFNDMDMRMGMFLYAFCIVMMVVAFKLFAFKGGYRKKPYGHDLLGKV